MRAYVYCTTEQKGEQTFYLKHSGVTYYLFTQEFRVSVRDHFRNGYPIDHGYAYGSSHSEAVRRTFDKIKKKIPLLEKRWNICVLRRTQLKCDKHNAWLGMRDRAVNGDALYCFN